MDSEDEFNSSGRAARALTGAPSFVIRRSRLATHRGFELAEPTFLFLWKSTALHALSSRTGSALPILVLPVDSFSFSKSVWDNFLFAPARSSTLSMMCGHTVIGFSSHMTVSFCGVMRYDFSPRGQTNALGALNLTRATASRGPRARSGA